MRHFLYVILYKIDFRCTFLGTVYATVIPSGKSGTGPEEFFSSSSETSDTNSIPVGFNLVTLVLNELSKHSLMKTCLILKLIPCHQDSELSGS